MSGAADVAAGREDRPPLSAGRGASAALVSRLLARALGLVFVVLVAREASTEEFAGYSYLIVVATTAGMLSDAGVGLIAGREVARGDLDLARAYSAGSIGTLASGAFAAAVVLAYGLVDSGPGTAGWALAAAAAYVLANHVFNFQAELIRTSGRPWTEAAIQIAGALLLLGLGAWVLMADRGLDSIMAVLVASQVVPALLAQAFLPAPWRGPVERPLVWELFRRGIWLSGATTALAVLQRCGAVTLGNVVSAAEFAAYSIALRFLDLGVMLMQTAGFGLLPALAQRAGRDHAEFAALRRRLLLAGAAGAALLTAPLVLVTPSVVTAVFGERYEDAGSIAQVFVGLGPVLVVLFLGWYALIAERRERAVLAAGAAGAGVALAGCAAVALAEDAHVAAWITAGGMAVAALVSSRAGLRPREGSAAGA